MNDLQIKVKKFGPKEIELSDGKKYMVKKEDEQELTFKDDKDSSEKDIKVKIKPKDKADSEYKDATLKVKYDGSWYSHGVKVSSKDVGSMTEKLKEEKDVSFGIKGFKPMFWIVTFSVLVVLAGLVWWWIASSKSEDKEEEGL